MASAPKEPVFRLYLVPELVDFYIDVPTTVALSLCLYPVKYLRYLGYCILGVDGRITRHKKPPSSSSSSPDSDGHDEPEEMPDSQTPLDAGEYYFAREDTGSQDGTQDGTEDGEEASQAGGAHNILAHTVDPEALTYSHAPESTATRESFRDTVAARDICCVFTNVQASSCQGVHILPFSKGNEWLKQIIESRVPEDGDVHFTSINDIRNGMLISNNIHPAVDRKELVVLKTPNEVLGITDVPPRSNNVLDSNKYPSLFAAVKYSDNPRYTLQWLNGNAKSLEEVPNNKDAAFKRNSKEPKPSPLLLHYNYGVAALKWWGHGQEHLLTARKRSTPPLAAPMYKLTKARTQREALAGGSGSNQDAVDIDTLRQTQAEELVLTLWANTPAAQAYRAEQQAEQEQWMTEWRNGVQRELEI